MRIEKLKMTNNYFEISGTSGRKLVGAIFLLFYISIAGYGQKLTNQRASWFVDARFGMFIHWGVYSGAEGFWKGEKLRDNNNYAEWIRYRNRISKEEYLTLLDKFNWDEIDPEQWVLLAKKAGMRYITITAKHHDGFALWNSKASDYNVAKHTDPSRDIIRELADACKKHGVKLGLYYSHWVDWEHPDSWDHTREITGLSNETYDRYWQEKVIPQMRELLTGYGDIGLIWFDMWVHHSKTVVSKVQLLQLKELIREIQPNCLINSRLGLSVEEDRDVDFQTLGDNQLGSQKKDHPWQTSATVAHSWGFHARDTEWKSTTTLLQSLINNVSLNGNFMLNIGPRANGEVPFEISRRLEEMGKWLAVNGESIYNSEAFDLRKDLHDWGRITYKKTEAGKHRLYLHVLNWPISKALTLTGIRTRPSKVYALADKLQAGFSFEHREVVTRLHLPDKQPDPLISVLVVEYDKQPEIIPDLVAKSVSGGFSLNPENWTLANGDSSIKKAERRGSIPEHVVIKNKSAYQWKLFIDEPGTYKIDASYSFQGSKAAGRMVVKTAGSTLEHQVQPTGKTVGEPNADWMIDSFNSTPLGNVVFTSTGIYNIHVEVQSKKEGNIKFQWIWLEKKSDF